MVVQRLLREAGRDGIPDDVVSVAAEGFEAQADWANLESPETYLGYEQGRSFASPGRPALDEPRTYAAPDTLEAQPVGARRRLDDRTAGLRARPRRRTDRVPLPRPRRPPRHGPAHARRARCRSGCSSTASLPATLTGSTSTSRATARSTEQRLYQLIRQPGPIADRTLEIAFLAPGVEAYVFTFG